MGSSFIHLTRINSNEFFLMAEEHSIVYTYHSFLIHSSADGHLGCFHVLAMINSARAALSQHHLLGFAIAQLEFHHIH